MPDNRPILYPTEKCLDCWNNKRIFVFFGPFDCQFRLVPAVAENPKTKQKEWVCFGYIDRPDKRAPAWRALFRAIKRALKHAEREEKDDVSGM